MRAEGAADEVHRARAESLTRSCTRVETEVSFFDDDCRDDARARSAAGVEFSTLTGWNSQP